VNIIDTNCQSLIDTVHIRLTCPYPNLDWEKMEYSKSGETYKTHIDNMQITWKSEVLTIYGSFPRFIKGNNIHNVSLREAEEGICSLEHKLGVSLRKAIITRLDLATNVTLERSIEHYFHCLGCYKNTHRSNIDKSSLYYMRKGFSILIFYDKIKEAGKKSVENYPIGANYENLMRFELRLFSKAIKHHFKDALKISDLINPETNKFLIELWYKEYVSIEKQSPLIFNLKENDGWREIRQKLIKEGIDSFGGLQSTLERLKREKYFNNKRSESRTRIKEYLRDIDNQPGMSKDAHLLNELNLAFSTVYRQFSMMD